MTVPAIFDKLSLPLNEFTKVPVIGHLHVSALVLASVYGIFRFATSYKLKYLFPIYMAALTTYGVVMKRQDEVFMIMLAGYWAISSILHLPTDFKLDKSNLIRKVFSVLVKLKELLSLLVFFPVLNKKIEDWVKSKKSSLPPSNPNKL